jgi:DNA adenine methylase
VSDSSSSASHYLSPLRYPGGKGRLARFVASLLRQQPTAPLRYVEPFAGGAGVALSLLFNEHVDEIVLNDLDPGVAAFWRAVFEHPDDLTKLVRSVRPTIDEWHVQHGRFMRREGDDLELGFATFFLNRTNRSGILDARPIGGFEQSGPWGIGARYNADELAGRIRRIARYATRVTVCEEDGIELAHRCLGDSSTFIYADPPYLKGADDLYLNALRWEDHQRLANYLRDADGWLLTYDTDPRVPDLYSGLRCATFDIAHTAAAQHIDREYAVFARTLVVGSLDGLGRNAELVAGGGLATPPAATS